METIIKSFAELSTIELYEIYKARVDVFVVEQNCSYPEIDELDLCSIHIYLKDEEGLQAYLRVIPPGLKWQEASIGRVLTKKRGTGLGFQIVSTAIEFIEKNYSVSIRIEAQVYAKIFYEKLGFKQCSETFLEDGIPHIQMIR